ncbi:MAG: carbon monoxide dehydrogenase subunit G [Roseiflexaceae bacterium]
MKITGSYTLDASREEVWAALNDIDVLARVVPGCERLEQHGEHDFEGTVKIGIQAIRGTYSGRIRFEDVQPPHHYKLVANGKSANGVVDGSGTVDLEELPDGKTKLLYGGEAQIGGVLASVGQRLIEGASRQLINQSLKALAEQIAQRRATAQAPTEPLAPPPPAEPEPAPAPVAAHDSAISAEIDQAAPAPTPVAQASVATASAPRKTVVVPESEQLKPESVVAGMIGDLYKERPWIVWVALAFVLGYLFGKSAR